MRGALLNRRRTWWLAAAVAAVAALPAAGTAGGRAAPSGVEVVGSATERQHILDGVKTLCRDFSFELVESPAGSKRYYLKKGERIGEVMKTPRGCHLVCTLVAHPKGKKLRITASGSVRVGETKNDGSSHPSADEFNGKGANAVVLIHDPIAPGAVVAYANAAGTEGAASPEEIVLAHELIHALHVMDGTVPRDGATAERETIETPPTQKDSTGSDYTTENEIRAEQNKANGNDKLKPRKGHCLLKPSSR